MPTRVEAPPMVLGVGYNMWRGLFKSGYCIGLGLCVDNETSMNLVRASQDEFSRCLYQSNHVIEDGDGHSTFDSLCPFQAQITL